MENKRAVERVGITSRRTLFLDVLSDDCLFSRMSSLVFASTSSRIIVVTREVVGTRHVWTVRQSRASNNLTLAADKFYYGG